MERAKYGSLKDLTNEEYRQHKAVISKQWRESHQEEVKEYNKFAYQRRKSNAKYEFVCKICGEKFFSHRKSAKICSSCWEKRNKTLQKDK